MPDEERRRAGKLDASRISGFEFLLLVNQIVARPVFVFRGEAPGSVPVTPRMPKEFGHDRRPRCVCGLHLFHYVSDMDLNGAFAHPQIVSNGFVGFT